VKSIPVIRNRAPGRVRVHWPVRVLGIRAAMGLTQRQFANLVGVSVDTLQNWEQGRRQPSGPSAILLRVLEVDPGSVLKALK
jgi:putative transcriptional regulator